MGAIIQDIRYGIRMLLKNPAFTVVAALALALGIGANTALFSVADAFLLKPLPLVNLDRLMMVLERVPKQIDDLNSVAPANFLDWKAQNHSVEQMAAYAWANVNITGDREPERVRGVQVTANFFDTLDVKPAQGRVFFPEEEHPGGEQVAVVGHGLWERRFGSDPNLVGTTVRLDGRSFAVIGIMPKGFEFPLTAELWTPLALTPKEQASRETHYLYVLGKLKSGVSASQAQAEMNAIARRLEAIHPQTNRGWGVGVVAVREYVTSDLTRHYTFLSLGAMMFVLLIACANVANLQFARTTSRQKEIAVRVALGANRWRVVRQLLTENVLVSLVGAALALLLAEWGIELTLAYMPPDVARYIAGWYVISLDRRAFLFTLLVAVLAGIISGLAPAFQSSKPDLNETLKEGSRSASSTHRHNRIRNILVVAELALAMVLLVGAGLMVKGVRALSNVNQNFAPETLLTMRLSLPDSKYTERNQRAAFYEGVLRRLQTHPQIQSAAVVTYVPFGAGGAIDDNCSIEGLPALESGELRIARIQTISPNYFRMMHIPLREGREFSDRDGPNAPQVAIISKSLAHRYWAGENPLGKRLKIGREDSQNPWLTIVGIVADVKYHWIEREPRPALYQPYLQAPQPFSYLAVRTTGDPSALVSAVLGQIAAVDPEQPASQIKTLDRVISDSILGLSYVAVIMTVLGVIAFILASVGVYGLMAYSVTERTHEIGIRMALGAGRREVLRMVMGRGILLTVIGMFIGLPISIALARLLASLIFGVSATDMITFVGASVVLAVVALTACYIPARRATRVDPMVALRYE